MCAQASLRSRANAALKEVDMKTASNSRLVPLGRVSSATQAVVTVVPQEITNPLLGYD